MELQQNKKIILIGKTGSGKTTLIQRIERLTMEYQKTQSVQAYLNFIDTPGEYLENRGYYKALIVTAADADAIGLVQDCTSEESWVPPMFSMAFSKETVGIVTKVDLAVDSQAVERAAQRLLLAGASRIFRISAISGTGIQALTDYISGSDEEGMTGYARGAAQCGDRHRDVYDAGGVFPSYHREHGKRFFGAADFHRGQGDRLPQ